VQAQQKGLNSITAEDLRMHLRVIASDESQGRDTPSTALNMVSRYLATMAEGSGCKPLMRNGSFFQNIPLEITSVSESKSRLRVLSRAGEELFYFPESFGGLFRASGSWGSETVFVGFGLKAAGKNWDDYADQEVSGKVVMLLDGQLPEGHALSTDDATLAARAAALRKKGAALVLTVISPEREKDMLARGSSFQVLPSLALVGTYPTQKEAPPSASSQPRRPQTDPKVQPKVTPDPRRRQAAARYRPVAGTVEIRHEAAARILGFSQDELKAMFASINRGQQVPRKAISKRIELSVVTATHTDSSPNVLAVLEGSDPVLKGEYVVITAHHDHIGVRDGKSMNGADDNGSGTVALLEIAQALSLERPKRSVILAWFTGEEKGLWGSHYFVNNCPVPLEKISAALNLDMISRNDPERLFLIASNHLSTELDESIRKQNDAYSRFKFDYVYNDRAHPDRFYYRSDHYPFIRVGIPTAFLFCGTTLDYHTPNDNIERVDFKKMEKVTRLTYLVTCEISNRPQLLKLDANPEVKTRGSQNASASTKRPQGQ
jgi:hypothetical protein